MLGLSSYGEHATRRKRQSGRPILPEGRSYGQAGWGPCPGYPSSRVSCSNTSSCYPFVTEQDRTGFGTVTFLTRPDILVSHTTTDMTQGWIGTFPRFDPFRLVTTHEPGMFGWSLSGQTRSGAIG